MTTVDDIAVLLGQPFDEAAIASVAGQSGRKLADDRDPGHPEDERHDYVVPSLGLQFLADGRRAIITIFFMIDGDSHVSAYPWSLANGLGPDSSPSDVRARMGTPEASGTPKPMFGLPPTGSWERFAYPPFGHLHVQYSVDGKRISQFTLMSEPPT